MQSGFTTFLIWVAIIGVGYQLGWTMGLAMFLIFGFLGKLLDNQYQS